MNNLAITKILVPLLILSSCGRTSHDSGSHLAAESKGNRNGEFAGLSFDVDNKGVGSLRFDSPFSGGERASKQATFHLGNPNGKIDAVSRDGKITVSEQRDKSIPKNQDKSDKPAINDRPLLREAQDHSVRPDVPSITRPKGSDSSKNEFNNIQEFRDHVATREREVRTGSETVLKFAGDQKKIIEAILKSSANRHDLLVKNVVSDIPEIVGKSIEVTLGDKSGGFVTSANTYFGSKIQNAYMYQQFAQQQINQISGEYKEQQTALVNASAMYLHLADAAYQRGDSELAEKLLSFSLEAADIGLSFVPGISQGKDAYAIATGKNLITGQELSDVELAVTAGFLFFPGVLKTAQASIAELKKASEILAKYYGQLAKKFPQLQKFEGRITKALQAATAEWKMQMLVRQISSSERVVHKAEELNSSYPKDWVVKPWLPGTNVQEFVTTEGVNLGRVHKKGSQIGQWLTFESELLNLSKEQIKQKLALPNTPDFVSRIHVPSGVKVRVGILDNSASWKERTVQIEIVQQEDKNKLIADLIGEIHE